MRYICVYNIPEVSVTQSCPTLSDPVDCSLPGFSVHGLLQARTLEWAAIPFSRGFSWPRAWTKVSCITGGFFTIWATREIPMIYLKYRTNQLFKIFPNNFKIFYISIYKKLWFKHQKQKHLDTLDLIHIDI